MSPCLSGTLNLQAGLAGPCAGVREAPVLGAAEGEQGGGAQKGGMGSCPAAPSRTVFL